jgi:hypothetical protein
MHGFMFCEGKLTFFYLLRFNFLVGKSTLFLLVDGICTLANVVIAGPILNKLSIMGNFFSWDGYDIGDSNERTLS